MCLEKKLKFYLIFTFLLSCKTTLVNQEKPIANDNQQEARIPFTEIVLPWNNFKQVIKNGMPRPSSVDKTVRIRVIHTNDIHSAVDMFPKLSAFIMEQKEFASLNGIIPIVDDAGDFYSGSLIQALGPRLNGNAAHMNPELEFLRRHSSNSILGNHEWDATQEGLAIMMSKLQGDKAYPGGILASNMILGSPSTGGENALAPYFFNGIMVKDEDGRVLKAFSLYDDNKKLRPIDTFPQVPMARGVLRIYRNKNTELKVGYIGLMGPSAVGGSVVTRLGSGLDFKDYDSDYVAEIVARLRDLGAELVIASCHAGKQPEGVSGPEEDKILAKSIPGIDIISAGHTHAAYPAKKTENLIRYQSGGHGQAVVTDILYTAKKGKLRQLVMEDSRMINKIELIDRWNIDGPNYRARSLISEDEIALWNQEFDNIINSDPRYRIEIPGKETVELKHDTKLIELRSSTQAAVELGDASSYESRIPLGKLATTAVREELNEILLSQNQQPLDIFLTAIELVRTEFPLDRPTLYKDVFSMLSRGVMKGSDGTLVPDGGKIAVMSMTKESLYHLVGMVEFYSRNIEVEATMAYSEGLEFKIQSGIPTVNNLKDFKLNGKSFDKMPKILRVGMSSFIAQNFRDKAFGIVNTQWMAQQINPRDSDMTMDILLARYLYKNSLLLEKQGVSGSAEVRREVFEKQKQRWEVINTATQKR